MSSASALATLFIAMLVLAACGGPPSPRAS